MTLRNAMISSAVREKVLRLRIEVDRRRVPGAPQLVRVDRSLLRCWVEATLVAGGDVDLAGNVYDGAKPSAPAGRAGAQLALPID
jgi:hypothetical protein